MSVKRSGDVTAAAVLMLAGSGITIVTGALITIALLNDGRGEPRPLLFLADLVFAIPVIWGIVNALGILRLRSWARLSTIVMSIAAICLLSFIAIGGAAAPKLTVGDPELPTGTTLAVSSVLLGLPLLAIGLAVWWIFLFTRKRVALEFAEGTLPSTTASAPVRVGISASKIPLSVLVIAILDLVVKVPMTVFAVFSSAMDHSSSLFLGMLVHGRMIMVVFLTMLAAGIIFSVATLLKRSWGIDGLLAIVFIGVVNAPLVLFSPSRAVYEAAAVKRLNADAAFSAQAASQFQHLTTTGIFSLGFLISATALYFLLTRRKAFRAACAASASLSSSQSEPSV